MKILLITGGDSSERFVSLTSAENVKKTLIEIGHDVTLYDLKNGYKPIIELSKNFDIIFPVLHGEEGEGGKLHKFLSKLSIPIVGTRNFKSLEKAWHKIPFKKFCDANEILTARWKIVKVKKDIVEFGFPSVLKASNGGSSREVVILKNKKDLDSTTANELLKSDRPLFVEKYIKGAEITVGILNDKALPILQIIPPKGSWFNYENKYSSQTQEIPNPASIPSEKQEGIKKTTLKIHRAFGLGSYSRIDYIYSDGIYYALEVNTIPGLTSGSLMPKQAKAAGLSFIEFLEKLIKSAK